jgi:hypothetical protein
MKTTSTAQYVALAANSSCRLAFVINDIAIEKRKVKTMRIPKASKVEFRLPIVVSSYIATTGRMRRMKMSIVMIMPASLAIRS